MAGPPSASVLEFAVRRLGDERVGLLLARRVEQDEPAPLGLDRHLPPGRLRYLPVAPLGFGALHEVLHGRLGRSFPRRTLHRPHQVSAGNPLYALELARALPCVRLVADEPLPLPGSLREFAQGRLVGLAGGTSRARRPPATSRPHSRRWRRPWRRTSESSSRSRSRTLLVAGAVRRPAVGRQGRLGAGAYRRT